MLPAVRAQDFVRELRQQAHDGFDDGDMTADVRPVGVQTWRLGGEQYMQPFDGGPQLAALDLLADLHECVAGFAADVDELRPRRGFGGDDGPGNITRLCLRTG